MKYKTLFIDLDDTIWDTRSNARESMEEVYRDYRFDRFFPTFDDYYSIYLPNNLNLWDQYRQGLITKNELIVERLLYPLRPFGIDDENFAIDLNDDFLNRTSAKTKLLPHAIEVLEYLNPNYEMYILSNGFEEVQYKKIKNSGLDSFFKGVILSDEIGVNKPHPAIFDYALQKSGALRHETLMIGDSLDADIKGAKNSDIDQAWLDLGIEKTNGLIPTFHVKTLLELKEFL